MAFGEFTHPSKLDIFLHQLEVTKAYLANRSTIPLSELWIRAKSQAAGFYQVHRTFARAVRALIPGESYGPFLDFWLRFYGLPDGDGGLGRIQDKGSARDLSLNVTSTDDETLVTGEELTDPNGLRYQVVDGPYSFTGVETKAVDLAAIDEGTATNLLTGVVLTFSDPPADIEEDATLILDLLGGRDREEDDAGRARLIDYTQSPSLSGNDVQWKRWIEDITEASVRAYIWPSRQNGVIGSVDYAATFEPATGAAKLIESSPDIEAAIEKAIEDNAPVNMLQNSRRVAVQTQEITPSIDLSWTLDPDAPSTSRTDWDSGAVKAELVTYTPAGPTVLVDQVLAGPLPDITAGVDAQGKAYHILMNGEEKLIITFNAIDNAKLLTLDSPFTVAPAVDSALMSGGGLAKAAWDAHQAYVDSLGPDRTASFGSPTVRWDDTYRVKKAQAAVDNVSVDVLDVTVTLPAANFAPTELLDVLTNLLIAPPETHIHEDKT